METPHRDLPEGAGADQFAVTRGAQMGKPVIGAEALAGFVLRIGNERMPFPVLPALQPTSSTPPRAGAEADAARLPHLRFSASSHSPAPLAHRRIAALCCSHLTHRRVSTLAGASGSGDKSQTMPRTRSDPRPARSSCPQPILAPLLRAHAWAHRRRRSASGDC
jgi:hypothetical protein